MAEFTIIVGSDPSSSVILDIINEQSNSCKTIWTIDVEHSVGETLNVNATNIVGTYILSSNDGNYLFNTNYTSTIRNVLTVEIENSGVPGQYNSITLVVTNVTTTETTSLILTRFNDGGIC